MSLLGFFVCSQEKVIVLTSCGQKTKVWAQLVKEYWPTEREYAVVCLSIFEHGVEIPLEEIDNLIHAVKHCGIFRCYQFVADKNCKGRHFMIHRWHRDVLGTMTNSERKRVISALRAVTNYAKREQGKIEAEQIGDPCRVPRKVLHDGTYIY